VLISVGSSLKLTLLTTLSVEKLAGADLIDKGPLTRIDFRFGSRAYGTGSVVVLTRSGDEGMRSCPMTLSDTDLCGPVGRREGTCSESFFCGNGGGCAFVCVASGDKEGKAMLFLCVLCCVGDARVVSSRKLACPLLLKLRGQFKVLSESVGRLGIASFGGSGSGDGEGRLRKYDDCGCGA
jgi:hypothetical protein